MATAYKPIIGLTCYSQTGPDWHSSAPTLAQDYLFRNYSHAVEMAGGLPLLLPVTRKPSTALETLEVLDGLILTGGPDLAPKEYGQEPKTGLGAIDAERDLVEIALARRIVEMDLPLLGICRGAQLVNVALGGTLFQSIPAEIPGSLLHAVTAPKRVNTHSVSVAPGSRLFEIVGSDRIMVNSGHHQAVRDLAPGLSVSATAPDGVIEALEKTDAAFFLGVQWHPEGTAEWDVHSRRLFEALVRAATLVRPGRKVRLPSPAFGRGG